MPDTTAGMQLQKFLDTLGTGEYEQYIKENFSKNFFESQTLAEHMDFFRWVSRMHDGFSVYEDSIEKSTEQKIIVVAKSKKRKMPGGESPSPFCPDRHIKSPVWISPRQNPPLESRNLPQ